MIFSDPDVADFVRDRFVLAWESIRPVPKVTGDFGNGIVHTRTLMGNVATYVCAPNGAVVDILPGLADPRSYRRDLQAALALYLSGRDVASHHRAAVEPAPSPSEPDGSLESFAQFNRTHRKPEVHALLSGGPVTPAEVRWRVFRDVLDIDLDDPFLGVIDALDAIEGNAYGHP